MMGFIIYGVYNGTNIATINNYSGKVFVVDTIWGTLLSGILSILLTYIIRQLN